MNQLHCRHRRCTTALQRSRTRQRDDEAEGKQGSTEHENDMHILVRQSPDVQNVAQKDALVTKLSIPYGIGKD